MYDIQSETEMYTYGYNTFGQLNIFQVVINRQSEPVSEPINRLPSKGSMGTFNNLGVETSTENSCSFETEIQKI